VLQPRVMALAVCIAALASLQYAWNFRGLWLAYVPPADLREACARFWVDVTKADWRESLVLGVPWTGWLERVRMYWFDLRQQFGIAGVGVAALGAVYLLRTRPAHGLLVTTTYVMNLLFALTYNVGDTHVFFLPSHLAVALFAAGGVKWLQSCATQVARLPSTPPVVAGLCLLYPFWRGFDTWPVVDRSDDRRPTAFLDGVVAGVTARDAVFDVDMNWQLENALDYYMKYRRPDLVWFRTGEVLAGFPAFARDNARVGRQILATPLGEERIAAAYSGQFEATPDPRAIVPTLRELVAGLPRGTPYALALLRPSRESAVDERDLTASIRQLTGGRTDRFPGRNFQIMLGTVGERPALFESRDHPYRLAARIGDLSIDVRMESWLPADTMRRAGFGHIIVNRRHALTLERGISFAAFEGNGRVASTAYQAGLLAPQPRYILQARP
jgi:hypothetical protein